jgi:Rrf2 family protein
MAVHVLCVLAHRRVCRTTSQQLADSVNVNPVIIRRLLLQLQEAKLIQTSKGAGAGSQLARSADQIHLADVYRAVEQDEAFARPIRRPNPDCPVGYCIQATLDNIFASAQSALEEELGRTYVSDILECMKASGEEAVPYEKPTEAIHRQPA